MDKNLPKDLHERENEGICLSFNRPFLIPFTPVPCKMVRKGTGVTSTLLTSKGTSASNDYQPIGQILPIIPKTERPDETGQGYTTKTDKFSLEE